ncbi:hypothetical protein JSQ73_005910 [Wolbachia endosymbiont of Anopheles demeilloni]|uniref:hypothetical protein n=1 Tax=Wolbachia endosymbiont of Anopheles demeilloni TaxID=2748871 RepID=UPI001F408C22|nr:hypothetical protein [Wolbachia endosymbiont of Anopheles demeilloni]UIP92668.1 hypothetical protein JSQ73_005910 [Wolbachia endosymbiont of Anopheles demeilloni]
MSNNIYSDQVNNSNLYANKLFYGEEGEQVENLGDQVEGEEDDKSEEDLLRDCRDETKKAKDKLIQCKKDAEKMKENGGQAINQEKCDDIKAEAEQAKLEAKLAKEEVLRYKIEQEKEELLKCKINMAKAETEWYKKAAEECKNEKRIGADKPSIKGGNENDRGKHVTNEGGNESGETTSREITPDLSLPEICGPKATLYKSDNKIGYQGFNTSDLLKELYPEMYSNSKILPYIEKESEGVYGAVNFKFAFTDTISSVANFGNTKCLKCIDSPQELAFQDEKVKSFCQSGNDYANKELNKNFFF